MTTGNANNDDQLAREQDALAGEIDALFAREGSPQAGDEALALRLANRAVAASMTDTLVRTEAPDELREQVMTAFEAEASPRAGDDALARRMATAALAAASASARSTSARRLPRWLGLPPVLMVLLVSSGVLAAGAVATAVIQPEWWPMSPTKRAARSKPTRAPRPVAAPAPATAPPALAPAPVEAAEVEEAPVPEPARRRAPGAPELFERANQLRRRGELAGAARAYESLVRSHPRSREAALARVSLADVREAQGRPAAALGHLDSYLRHSGDGTLVEDALRRKARVLQSMGKTRLARETWRDLVTRFPRTVYRAEAEAELAKPTRRR